MSKVAIITGISGHKEFIIRSHHALNKGGDLNYA